jgi:hypothetical protein
MLDSIIRYGIYVNTDPPDDCAGLTIEEIMKGYGIHGEIRRCGDGKTGAGQAQEDPVDVVNVDNVQDDNQDDSMVGSNDITFNDKFTAPPVRVPRVVNPFTNIPQLHQVFMDTFKQAEGHGIIPEGYGIQPSEWEYGAYPSFYHIRSGKKGRELRVELPDLIWRPRTEMWVRALDIYNNLLARLDDM